MPADPLREAAVRVLAEPCGRPNCAYVEVHENEARRRLDAFLASPECLALAVRSACGKGSAWSPGNRHPNIVLYRARPDVAALLESSGGEP